MTFATGASLLVSDFGTENQSRLTAMMVARGPSRADGGRRVWPIICVWQLGVSPALAARTSATEPIKIQVDNWHAEQSEQLRNNQAPGDRDAERPA